MEIKALVADSSNKSRKNITRSLNEIGVTKVIEAADAKQAMEFLKSEKFDVFFTEWNTQTSEGEELVNAARKVDSNLPIIVTAPKSKKVAELKKEYPNASNYITAPFNADQLRKTVSHYVPSIAS